MTQNDWIRAVFKIGYRVSTDGLVMSPSGKLRVVDLGAQGYARISVRPEKGKNPTEVRIHKLVAYQKYGERAFREGMLVRHRDGNKANIKPRNILIGTQHQNMMDRPATERRAHAKKAALYTRKLSSEQADALRRDHDGGLGYKRLSKKYGISKSAVRSVLRRITYVD